MPGDQCKRARAGELLFAHRLFAGNLTLLWGVYRMLVKYGTSLSSSLARSVL